MSRPHRTDILSYQPDADRAALIASHSDFNHTSITYPTSTVSHTTPYNTVQQHNHAPATGHTPPAPTQHHQQQLVTSAPHPAVPAPAISSHACPISREYGSVVPVVHAFADVKYYPTQHKFSKQFTAMHSKHSNAATKMIV